MMREEDLDIALKVVIVGNGGVGKSSMIQRYCRGTFTREYKKTIGVDFLERQIELDGEDVRLMLWDTAGQEEFDAITKAYYRGAQACVLAFSTTDRQSFEAIFSWKLKVENECGIIPTVIVQNKIDLMDQCVVEPMETEKLSRSLGCKLIRTSVKEDINVVGVFRHLAAKCLAELRMPQYDFPSQSDDSLLYTKKISAFSPSQYHKSGTIILQANKKGRHALKKKNVFKNACGFV